MNFMNSKRRTTLGLLSLFTILALVFGYTATVYAQAETATLTGAVRDQSGAVVPKAAVTVTNTGTGASRSTVTDDIGNYTVTNLIPTIYNVSVEAKGFGKSEKRVELTVGSKVALDFSLTVGAAVVVVEVSAAGGVAVNTQNQTLGQVISSKEVSEGPAINLNPYEFIRTVGNIADSDASPSGPIGFTGSGAGVTINGLRSASTNVLLDGAANNDEFVGTVGQQVPLASVDEFSVLTNNFTAEYGRAAGGVVNVVTKSGTNNYHGSLYEVNRLSGYGANDFFNNANGIKRPVYTRNQFGGAVGGPIKKNKMFFFVNPEWTRIRSSASTQAVIPDAMLIAASDPVNTQPFFTAFGQLRPSLTTLQTFSRAQLIALGSDPCAGSTGACTTAFAANSAVPLFDKVQYSVPSDSGGGSPQNTYDVVARFDYNISDKTQFYTRYARYKEVDPAGVVVNSPYSGPNTNGFDSAQTIINDNALLSLTRSIGARWTEQTKFVYNRLGFFQPLGANPVGPTLYWNKNIPSTLGGTLLALPGYSQFTPGNAIPFGGPQNFYQSYEDVSYIRGKHQFRFGGSWVFLQDNRTFGAYEEAVESLGTSGVNGRAMDRLLTGQLRTFTVAIDPQGKLPCGSPGMSGAIPTVVTPSCTLTLPATQPNFSRSNRFNELAVYGQDSWKVTPRLTLNLGLRWEYYGIQHNKNPQLDSNFYNGSGATLQEQIRNGGVSIAPLSSTRSLWAKDYKDFAPRLGFAWDIFGDGKTAFRGGYGVSYERNFGNVTYNVIQNPPAYAVVDLTGGVDPGCCTITNANLGAFAGAGTKPVPRLSLRNVADNIKTAYAYLWSASLEREVVHNMFVAIEYSGSKGQRLYTLDPVNRTGSGEAYLGDPLVGGLATLRLNGQQYGTINRREGNGFSSYNSLNLRLNVANIANSGLNLVANYTYAHAFDNLSTTFSTSSTNANLGLLDPFNPSLDRGPADFDIRHRLAISGTWEVPYGRNTHGVVRQLADGWVLAPVVILHTGTPFSEFDFTNTQFQEGPRLILTGPVPRTGSGNPPPVPGLFDQFNYLDLTTAPVAEFINPLTGNSEFGPYPKNMTGRNFFRGPGTWTIDFGVHKKFFITERYTVEFRADMFDIFNHANAFLVGGSTLDFSTQTQVFTCRGFCVGGIPQQHRNIQLQLKLAF